jgi:hypothetical protein
LRYDFGLKFAQPLSFDPRAKKGRAVCGYSWLYYNEVSFERLVKAFAPLGRLL